MIGFTLLRLPHDSHDMKKIRFSFVSSVSGDLQVLQVTYSTVGRGKFRITLESTRGIPLTDVSAQHVLHLFLLESTFDDKSAGSIHASCRSHLRKQELDDVFRLRKDRGSELTMTKRNNDGLPVCAFFCKYRSRSRRWTSCFLHDEWMEAQSCIVFERR